MVRSGGTALAVLSTIASACTLIFLYWPVPTRESTIFSRLGSSSDCQSCTIDQTLKALACRSASVGGAVSISFCFVSHQPLAAVALSSFVSGRSGCLQETAYILPLCFLIQRRESGIQVIRSLRAIGILPRNRLVNHRCRTFILGGEQWGIKVCKPICKPKVGKKVWTGIQEKNW